jgi:hypothetical protein
MASIIHTAKPDAPQERFTGEFDRVDLVQNPLGLGNLASTGSSSMGYSRVPPTKQRLTGNGV